MSLELAFRQLPLSFLALESLNVRSRLILHSSPLLAHFMIHVSYLLLQCCYLLVITLCSVLCIQDLPLKSIDLKVLLQELFLRTSLGLTDFLSDTLFPSEFKLILLEFLARNLIGLLSLQSFVLTFKREVFLLVFFSHLQSLHAPVSILSRTC